MGATRMQDPTRFATYEQDGVAVVHPRREILDLTVAMEFSEVLDRAASTGHAVLVDLAAVSYLDSVIISVLVKRYVAQRQVGRRLVLFGLQEYVEDLLKSTGLLAVMDIRHDLKGALKLASQPVDPAEIARYGRADDVDM